MPILERPALTRAQRIFFLTLFSLVMLAPFYYQPNLGGEGLSLPYNASIWTAALICLAAGLFTMLLQRRIVIPRYSLLILLFPAGLIAGGFITGIERPSEWLIRLGVIGGGVLFWFALFQYRPTRRQVDTAAYLLLASLLLQAFIGLTQVLPPTPISSWLPYVSNGVIAGFYQQPNLQASMMATALALALYQASTPGFSNQRWPIQGLVLMTLLLSTLNLISIGSRVGLLGAILAAVLLLIARYRQLLRRPLFALLMLLAIGGGALLGNQLSNGASRALDKMERLADDGGSQDARANIYRIAWLTFLDAPLFGHGIGSFQHEFQQQRVPYQQQHPDAVLDDKRFSHPHNELLFWMIEGGLLALASLACAGLAVLLQLWRMGRQRGLAMAALLVPIALHTEVELPFYISNVHWLVFMLLLFLCFQSGKRERPLKISGSAVTTLSLSNFIAIPLLCMFLTHTLLAYAGVVQFMRSQGSQPQQLQLALNNLYTRELGEYFLMRTLLYTDFKRGQSEQVEQFINWASQFLKQTPDMQIYRDLAQAQAYLKQQTAALETIQQARAIYPNNPAMKKLEQDLLAQRLPVKPDTSASAAPAPLPASPAQ